jgi:hypothetical protein
VSGAVTITTPDADAVELHYSELMSHRSKERLLRAVGLFAEGKTARRFATTKMAPDGVPWQVWSDRYAVLVEKEGNPHHTLLVGKIPTRKDPSPGGDLRDSIVSDIDMSLNQVQVGSNLPYAATHQWGDDERHISARPYLGFGDADLIELDELVVDFLGSLV